ncbi:PqqD family protein [Streptomyces chrestomyceticus]|uniref:PqqD family protein n=1 Tax=Streptomyces chrestomyceticus TaxID=68185 RepID=UPI00340D55F8
MLTPAGHIHHATGPQGTAVLDVRRGRWLMLDADASRIWRAVTVRGGTAGLADEIAVPTGQDPQKVGGRITAFLDELVAAGVLIDTARPRRAQRGRWHR